MKAVCRLLICGALAAAAVAITKEELKNNRCIALLRSSRADFGQKFSQCAKPLRSLPSSYSASAKRELFIRCLGGSLGIMHSDGSTNIPALLQMVDNNSALSAQQKQEIGALIRGCTSSLSNCILQQCSV